MKSPTRTAIAVVSCMLGVACVDVGSACAQSIWNQRDPWRAFQFADTQARRVGDLITVVISENTDVQNRDERGLEAETDGGFQWDFASASNSGAASAEMETNLSSNRSFDGSSNYDVEQQFSDQITAQIMRVLPNGNFAIYGCRERHVAGEVRRLTVSGIVRPIDIRPNNTIQSRFVANFQIKYMGKGPESRFTNQGWLGRLGNKVWPF